MFQLDNQFKQSPLARELERALENRLEELRKKCGRPLSDEPLTDQVLTARFRGRIAEVTEMLKNLLAGQEDASGPVIEEDESP